MTVTHLRHFGNLAACLLTVSPLFAVTFDELNHVWDEANVLSDGGVFVVSW